MRAAFSTFVVIVFAVFFISTASAQQTSPDCQSLPPKEKDKLTTLGKYATAVEAFQMYRSNPGKVFLLDVRTPEEYVFVGHADSAANIPLKLWKGKFNAEGKGYPLADNPDFDAAVKQKFKPDDVILVMCRSGARSAEAINRMAAAGFTNVYQIVDGFEGDKVTDEESYSKGKRVKNGWRNAGLPWTYDLDPRLVYAVPAQ